MRRAQIIDAATRALAAHGFGGASLTKIAAEVGISKGLVLYHFGSRTELMREVVFAQYGRMAGAALEGIDWKGSATAILRDLITRSIRVSLERGEVRRAIAEVIGNLRDGDGRHVITFDQKDDIYTGFEKVYRQGQESGEFRDFEPRPMAVIQQSSVDGAVNYLESHVDTDASDFSDSVADLLIAAVRSENQGHPGETP
ncbi:DNA-binding transcriptional regulator, AcrR family [Prauserella marina]|uniref:DNA-binding transcriptional regulator, AcrR family n=2 Tax=Prauserella marina TaxID=530584 RepID=A0A1G6NJ38_9PSEU|nr:TetR family transcriptional regulator [Prauserella marina]SDC67952.1 DNA-binding transcriptional regulator, AcrR family [Prauserella marina]